MRKRGPAFTMVELAMSVAILLIMGGMIIPSARKISNMFGSYKQITVLDELYTVKEGINIYRRLYGCVPSGYGELVEKGIIIGQPISGRIEIEEDGSVTILCADGVRRNEAYFFNEK